ncbi:MAG: hypothetical protein J6A15_01530 [Clostridia bacterium]|nr:hypothetical protein [Clostridia bacterium]
MGLLLLAVPWVMLIASIIVYVTKRRSKIEKFDEIKKEILIKANAKTKTMRILLIMLVIILTFVFFLLIGAGTELFCNNRLEIVGDPLNPFERYEHVKTFSASIEDLIISAIIIPLDICLALFVSYCVYIVYLKNSKKLSEEERKVALEINSGFMILGIIISTISLIGKWFFNTILTATVEKPIIYLYPEEKQRINVKLEKKGILTCTYPKYNDGWNVIASPDGTLEDDNGRKYYALYWEGKYNVEIDKNIGFCVKGEETIKFLEEKLEKLGLTEREAQEFIVYWLPKLENNKYNYIYFMQTEEVNKISNLDISPSPDTLIRILMAFKPLTKEIEVKEQQIATPKREGFTVVEWGGTEI